MSHECKNCYSQFTSKSKLVIHNNECKIHYCESDLEKIICTLINIKIKKNEKLPVFDYPLKFNGEYDNRYKNKQILTKDGKRDKRTLLNKD